MTWQCETRCASASTRLATAALWSAAQNSSMSVASTTCAAKAILAALNDGEVLVTAVAMDEQAVNALPTAVFSNRRVEFERDADGAAHGDDRAVYCIAASDDERTRLIAELDELTSKLNGEADALALAQEDAERKKQKHIKLLHDYNETRDAAHIVFGQLAAFEQSTVQEVYERFGVSIGD